MLTAEQATKIEYIVSRLKKSQIDIINWLNNFKKEDWNTALEVLSHVDFFDADRISSHYEAKLVQIINEIETNHVGIENWLNNYKPKSIEEKYKIKFLKRRLRRGFNKPFLHAVGNYGKSGTAMMYYATHIPSFKKLKVNTLKSIANLTIKNLHFPINIIILDDFIGTGKTIVEYINKEIFPICNTLAVVKINLYILSVVIHEEAKEYIIYNSKIKDVKFYGQVRRKAFSKKGSVFGYRPRMIAIREFCYKYGSGLYKQFDYQENREIEYQLGYMNSQSLSVFTHATPNNTLPIIWSNKNGWHPIFPRSTEERISQSKEFKMSAYVWISVAEKLNLSKLFNRSMNVYSTENVKLICYIKLLRTGLNRLSIGIKLNLSDTEMDELVKIGFKQKILTKTGDLAGYGAQLYTEITNEMKRKRDRTFLPNEVIYLPSKFRGKV